VHATSLHIALTGLAPATLSSTRQFNNLTVFLHEGIVAKAIRLGVSVRISSIVKFDTHACTFEHSFSSSSGRLSDYPCELDELISNSLILWCFSYGTSEMYKDVPRTSLFLNQSIQRHPQQFLLPSNISTTPKNSKLPKAFKMKLLTATSLFSILALTSAIPTATPALETQSIRQVQNGAGCSGAHDSFALYFTIRTWGPWQETDYGQGLLDNLRGQCGWITSWGFNYLADGSGYATFNTADTIRGHCVEDAVWLASNPTGAIEGLQCSWDF
jgi:hypothetical protein